MKYTAVFLFVKGSLFFKRFNSLMQRITSVGLTDKWYRDVIWYYINALHRVNNVVTKPLSLKHLQSAFLLLVVGLSISSLVFLFEICFCCIRRSLKYKYVHRQIEIEA